MRCRSFAIATFLLSAGAFAQKQSVTEVHTALNHVTVIELPETITKAAAGSDSFEITRHGNQAFIEPYRPGVSTNLLLETAHSETMYELEAAGEVKDMDVLIVSKPHVEPSPAIAAAVHDSEMQKIADMVMSETLLQTQHISQRDFQPVKNGVSVQIEDVVYGKDSLYVRYQVINDGKTPYRLSEPSVEAIRPTQPAVSLRSFLYTQLSYKSLVRVGLGQTTGVPVVRSEIPDRDVAPGRAAAGVIAVRVSDASPQVYRLVFGNDGAHAVVAIAVL